MRGLLLLVCVLAIGCGRTKGDGPGAGEQGIGANKKHLDLAFGPCTTTKGAFVSGGPRVLPARATIDGRDLSNELKDRAGFGVLRTRYEPLFAHAARYSNGYGYGGHTGQRVSAVPTVSIGEPVTNGSLDKPIIRRYIKRNIQKIEYCYEKELLADPALGGTVTASFFITPDGTVKNTTAHGVQPTVASCIASVIQNIEFPKPKDGGDVQVSYQFTFRTAEGGGRPAKDADIVQRAPPAETPPPIVDDRPAPSVFTERSLLDDIRGELESCVRGKQPAFGAFVVDLTFDGEGVKVTDASVAGIADTGVVACLVTAAKRLTRTQGGGPSLRCSAAFGDVPFSALPVLAIGADLVWNGVVTDHVKDVMLDASPSPIASLGEMIDEWLMPRASTVSTVPIRGPALVQPIDSTPMKVVNRAIATVRSYGVEIELGAQDGTKFRALRTLRIPSAPSPTILDPAIVDRVMLSVYLTKQHTWVGVSRSNEYEDLPADDWARLEQTLRDHKLSASFADRADIELGADDDVLYEDIVKAIGVATRVGFEDWYVLPPAQLSALPTW